MKEANLPDIPKAFITDLSKEEAKKDFEGLRTVYKSGNIIK